MSSCLFRNVKLSKFISIPDKRAIIRDIHKNVNLKPTQRAVLAELAWRRNQYNGLCCPSHKTIAKKFNISTRTVERTVAYLEASGFIEIKRELGRTNKYTIVAIEELITKINLEKSKQELSETQDNSEKKLHNDGASDKQNVPTHRQNGEHKKEISGSHFIEDKNEIPHIESNEASNLFELKVLQNNNCPLDWIEKSRPCKLFEVVDVLEWKQKAHLGTMLFFYGIHSNSEILEVRFRTDEFDKILKNNCKLNLWASSYVDIAFKCEAIDQASFMFLKGALSAKKLDNS